MEDSWELMREAANNVLRGLGQPLPGFETPARVSYLLSQGVALVNNPKPEQADAGASLIALVHASYVCNLGWVIEAKDGVLMVTRAEQGGQLLKSLDVLRSIVGFADGLVAQAEVDMVAACGTGFLQGWLLTIRYVCEDVSWYDAMKREEEVRFRPCDAAQTFRLLNPTVLRLFAAH
jgi:hypothetical protein